MQSHESRTKEKHELALELGQVLVKLGQPEQAQASFTPTDPDLDQDTKFRLLAASGQLRYSQWLQAWEATLLSMTQEGDRASAGRFHSLREEISLSGSLLEILILEEFAFCSEEKYSRVESVITPQCVSWGVKSSRASKSTKSKVILLIMDTKNLNQG